MHSLTTRHQAERWLTANPTPAPAQLRAFINNQPRVLPTGPAEAPGLSWGVLRFVLRAFAILAVLALGFLVFLLFGEDRAQTPQRPALTNAQRAKAFRL